VYKKTCPSATYFGEKSSGWTDPPAMLFVGPPRAWDAQWRQAGGQLLAPSGINTDNRHFGQTQVATDTLSRRVAGRTGAALSNYPQQPSDRSRYSDDT